MSEEILFLMEFWFNPKKDFIVKLRVKKKNDSAKRKKYSGGHQNWVLGLRSPIL